MATGMTAYPAAGKLHGPADDFSVQPGKKRKKKKKRGTWFLKAAREVEERKNTGGRQKGRERDSKKKKLANGTEEKVSLCLPIPPQGRVDCREGAVAEG